MAYDVDIGGFMDPCVFWFRVVPAGVIIPLILASFVLWARFIPDSIRRRDAGAIVALVWSYALFIGVLACAIETIRHPPSL